MNNQLIYIDEKKLQMQISYNEDYSKQVNNAIAALKLLAGELTDEQLRTFLSAPESLAGELVGKAKAEYDKWMSNAPESVKASSPFSDGGVPAKVLAMHKKLSKPFGMKVDATEIVDGVCTLTDEGKERLKEHCSIYGNGKAKRVYELSVEACKVLNELDKEIRLNNASAECVECWGRWQGYITINDRKEGEVYQPNPYLLDQLRE